MLVSIAIIERYIQEALIVRERDIARVGNGSGHIAIGCSGVENHNIGNELSLIVLMSHTDTHIRQTIEEHAVLEVHILALLTNVVQDLVHALICRRNEVVANEKSAYRNTANKNDQGAQDAR